MNNGSKRPKEELFNEKVVRGDGCWGWTAKKNKGYGMFCIEGRGPTAKFDAAHRVSYRLYKGDIPKGMRVLHTCDTPACTNPEHLYLGSQADNMRDMSVKGRNSKLTPYKARAIRIREAWGEDRKTLAAEYGVSRHVVYDLCIGRRWVALFIGG